MVSEQTKLAEEMSSSIETIIREIWQKTHNKYSAGDKVWILLVGLRGKNTALELCSQKAPNLTGQILNWQTRDGHFSCSISLRVKTLRIAFLFMVKCITVKYFIFIWTSHENIWVEM
jgi:hypothetical protein